MTKQNDILSTAERLFDQQGFHATGIDQIVREAGVTPRTLYRYFVSKEELILEVLEQREIRYLKKLHEIIYHPVNTSPNWIQIFSELENWFTQESDKGCLFLRVLAEYQHKDMRIVRRVILHKERTLAVFKELFFQMTTEEFKDKAESLMLIIEGAVALAPVIGGKAAVTKARQLAQHIFTDISHPLPC